MTNKKLHNMTPLSIGFEKVSKEDISKWLKLQCKQLHEEIKKDKRYGYRFFSGKSFMYIVKFHHDDTYDIYRMRHNVK